MTDEQTLTGEQESLYTRLGGYDAIYVFAAEALKKAMVHPAIGHIWAHIGESTFYKEHINMVEFLAQHWGGNVRYRGRDMVTVHRGMGLTDEHWSAMFDCLEECYEQFGIAQELRVARCRLEPLTHVQQPLVHPAEQRLILRGLDRVHDHPLRLGIRSGKPCLSESPRPTNESSPSRAWVCNRTGERVEERGRRRGTESAHS